jgi:hypothetical protein
MKTSLYLSLVSELHQWHSDEGCLPKVPQDPIRMSETRQRVRAKVRSLESSGAGFGDVQSVLEVFVQGVKEAVAEAL